MLYLFYTSDIPSTNDTLLASFIDKMVTFPKGDNFKQDATKTQRALNSITTRKRNWRFKQKRQKSTNINFTYKRNKKDS